MTNQQINNKDHRFNFEQNGIFYSVMPLIGTPDNLLVEPPPLLLPQPQPVPVPPNFFTMFFDLLDTLLISDGFRHALIGSIVGLIIGFLFSHIDLLMLNMKNI